MLRLSNTKECVCSEEYTLQGQGEVISKMLARALQEMEETAGPDQQITSISVELGDAIRAHGGDNMLTLRFVAKVDTILR